MTTFLLISISFCILLPILLWIDYKSISDEEWQEVESWHNFKKAIEKGQNK